MATSLPVPLERRAMKPPRPVRLPTLPGRVCDEMADGSAAASRDRPAERPPAFLAFAVELGLEMHDPACEIFPACGHCRRAPDPREVMA